MPARMNSLLQIHAKWLDGLPIERRLASAREGIELARSLNRLVEAFEDTLEDLAKAKKETDEKPSRDEEDH